jgi:hypothetical protein
VTGQHRRRTLDDRRPRPTPTDLAQMGLYAQSTQPPTQPTQRREYRVYFKTIRTPSTQNRRAFTFAWGTSPEEAVAQVRRHHGPLMVTSVELVSTGEVQHPTLHNTTQP